MKVSLLATGDELTNGDILNTNGQTIALKLIELGFTVGNQLLVTDDEKDIIDGIHFLLKQHDILIITGGLGPTSDDRTRFALAKAINKELFFHEPSWEKITARIKQFKFEVHESNKQQALFPEGAAVIANPHGTAPGCMIQLENKVIFMLPGPPRECLPMFNDYVVSQLQLIPHDKAYQFFKWRLFGVNESEVAAQLDKLVCDHHCLTGYRWDYPYLEFKLRIPLQTHSEKIIASINQAISQLIICDPEHTAADLLKNFLKQYTSPIAILDNATGGLLEYKLSHPQTLNKLIFVKDKNKLSEYTSYFEIEGLEELWSNTNNQTITHLKLLCHHGKEKIFFDREIPFRDHRVVEYAVEYIAYEIKKYLTG